MIFFVLFWHQFLKGASRRIATWHLSTRLQSVMTLVSVKVPVLLLPVGEKCEVRHVGNRKEEWQAWCSDSDHFKNEEIREREKKRDLIWHRFFFLYLILKRLFKYQVWSTAKKQVSLYNDAVLMKETSKNYTGGLKHAKSLFSKSPKACQVIRPTN